MVVAFHPAYYYLFICFSEPQLVRSVPHWSYNPFVKSIIAKCVGTRAAELVLGRVAREERRRNFI